MAKGAKTGGRKPGSVNKISGEVKEMVLQALDEAGGVAYLKRQAVESPNAFLSLIGKIIPMQVAAEVTGDMAHSIEFAIVDPTRET